MGLLVLATLLPMQSAQYVGRLSRIQLKPSTILGFHYLFTEHLEFNTESSIDKSFQWDSISDIELKRQEILPLQFYYDDIDIKILHYATSGKLFSSGDRYISA